MLPGQMSLWQLESVPYIPRNLHLKFHQNQISYSWDIADIEFVWVLLVSWVVCKVIFGSNPTKVMLGWVELMLSWGLDKKNNPKSMETKKIKFIPGESLVKIS